MAKALSTILAALAAQEPHHAETGDAPGALSRQGPCERSYTLRTAAFQKGAQGRLSGARQTCFAFTAVRRESLQVVLGNAIKADSARHSGAGRLRLRRMGLGAPIQVRIRGPLSSL